MKFILSVSVRRMYTICGLNFEAFELNVLDPPMVESNQNEASNGADESNAE